MRLLVVNPNTTPSMTRTIGAAARAVAAPGTEIVAVEPSMGPASIEGVYDGALAVPGLLQTIAAQPADGIVIACFDDTGLDAARSAAAVPVVGIGEAAYHVASLVSDRFTVITTLSRSVPVIERNLAVTGLRSRCARVRASDIPVLALEEPGSDARRRISDMVARALQEDGADGIVLGCAGMADFAAELSRAHGVPVIDGVAAAVKLIESLLALGLSTSKAGIWARPLAKPYQGSLAAFSPRS
ncbi:aspartate/glutamate racemase family protein [Jiella sp. M17.18]|uniref:aspartate/glutamate racemase family protein n=1 Tax=Jiella sp. M17.18 TaxID=3234247 RepID=UPI0034DFACFF